MCLIKDTAGTAGHGAIYELPYWDTADKSGFVHFSRVELVRAAVLDLCVVHPEGAAIFDSNAGLPDSLNEAWRQHMKKLSVQLKKESQNASQVLDALDSVKSCSKELRRIAAAKVSPCCSNTGRFKSVVDENGFKVNIRRVGRVNATLATDILRSFARHQSRTAFDRSVITDQLLNKMN